LDPYSLLLYIAVILLVGYVFGKIVGLLHLPEISGYILAGLVIGPSMLNLIDHTAIGGLSVILNVVLAVIAYQIGTELWLPKLKKHGVRIVFLTLIHAIGVAVIVFFGTYLLMGELWLALALSALAVATAPAPIMVIIHKLHAKGPLSDTIVPFLGILDITAVLMFGLLSSIAVSLVSGAALDIFNTLLIPLKEVALSVIVGAIFGAGFGIASKLFLCRLTKDDQYTAYLVMALAFITLSVWVAHTYHLSMILIPLITGMVFTNFIGKETFLLQDSAIEHFERPFIILFFTIVGLDMSLGVLRDAGALALLYIFFRVVGVIVANYLGATITGYPATIKKHMGLSLLSQGGVTIGMLIALTTLLPEEEARIIQTVVLSSILFFEIVGPAVFQSTLEKVGEIKPPSGMFSVKDGEKT